MININDIENNLKNMDANPNQVISIMLNMIINQQARIEAMINSQAMIMAELQTSKLEYKDIMKSFEIGINDRINEIQAQVASKLH